MTKDASFVGHLIIGQTNAQTKTALTRAEVEEEAEEEAEVAVVAAVAVDAAEEAAVTDLIKEESIQVDILLKIGLLYLKSNTIKF